MTSSEFEFMAKLLEARSGLMITPDKTYLLDSRLGPVARKFCLADVAAIVAKLRSGHDEALARAVTEAMTTNESFFFRDKTPFEHFEKVMMPALLKARLQSRRIRIWCAAASTGQEPYSLAMILRERAAQLKDWTVEILATDLAGEVLSRAQQGLYSQFEVQRGLPVQMLVKYFKKEGDHFRIKDDVRAMVQFKQANLLEPFAGFGQFDIIFCRNVLIYFNQATKQTVLDRIAQVMAPDGFLCLGAAETVLGVTQTFGPVDGARGVYAKAKSEARNPVRATA